ncbi:MAG: LCP family protein [Lachnospiraceae bacterium]|nr:LCP family protein [Lachnospiraceae bacterium]
MNHKGRVTKIIGLILTIAMLAVSLYAVKRLSDTGLLPAMYIRVAIAGVFVVFIFLVFMLRWKISRIVSIILSAAIIVAIVVFGIKYIDRTNEMLENVTGAQTQVDIVDFYVRADDKAESLNDLKDYEFGILEALDRENTDKALKDINDKLGTDVKTKSYNTIFELADAILNKECGAIVLNRGYLGMITDEETYADFAEKTKVISGFTIETVVKEVYTEEVDPESDAFVVYISGIDTHGPVSVKSRSDVNIIAVINPTTKELLLVSTPRDYYVPLSISGGVKDKLTHAGNYGIDVSMDTLGMLYGIDVEYYFRINFTGFVNVIDALGGINVYSDYAFEGGGYTFQKGYNQLDGKQALAFARERYAFSQGDRQRGRNQMAVISAVIEKLTSTSGILNSYMDLMASLESSFQTNMSQTMLGAIVSAQLENGSGWHISRYSVNGTDSNAVTFSIPEPKYVMEPDMDTVNKAVELIKKVVDGGVLTEADLAEETEVN